MNAHELMTTGLVVVPPDMPVSAVAELLASRSISAVPVTAPDGTLLGLVTEGDLIHRLAETKRGPLGWFLALFGDRRKLAERFVKAHGARAADLMTRELVTVGEDSSAEQIAQLMEQHHIRRVPVLREGKLVGIVSRADLLRAALLPPPPTLESGGTDAAILRRLMAALREQPWVDSFYIHPDVVGGRVVFYGFHRSAEAQHAMDVLARAIPGVLAVEDRTTPMPFFMPV
jgi:CBS domain-containing protein